MNPNPGWECPGNRLKSQGQVLRVTLFSSPPLRSFEPLRGCCCVNSRLMHMDALAQVLDKWLRQVSNGKLKKQRAVLRCRRKCKTTQAILSTTGTVSSCTSEPELLSNTCAERVWVGRASLFMAVSSWLEAVNRLLIFGSSGSLVGSEWAASLAGSSCRFCFGASGFGSPDWICLSPFRPLCLSSMALPCRGASLSWLVLHSRFLAVLANKAFLAPASIHELNTLLHF